MAARGGKEVAETLRLGWCRRWVWRIEGKKILLPFPDASATCTITLSDSPGIRHSVEVVAGSLFEAAVLDHGILRKDQWFDRPVAATKIEVELREPATKHTVILRQIEQRVTARRSLRLRGCGRIG